jgi:two-component system phosphate regulon sensor histidine kinase PhoR
LLNLLRSPAFASYANAREWEEPAIVKITHGGQSHSIMLRMVKYLRDQYLLIARDLTQIEKLETTRKDFVANVSHELRTPLTVLTGFVETLKDAPAGALTAEQREQYFNMMYQQAQRMEALVSDLLTLSNIETSPSAAFATVDMDALIEQERQQIEALSANRHRLDWEITPGLNVYGDRAELASALLNLMTNAVRYTPTGGLIKIRWAPEMDGGAKFSVIDNGIGIASEHIPRLSERFYRVDRGRSREVGGTGLGLAIAKHIALRHETALDIQSKLGQGSTFSLVFPPERLVRSHTREAIEENVSAT